MDLKKKHNKPTGWGQRHTFAILGLVGFAISYAIRFNLSIAIVAMVNSTAITPKVTTTLPIFPADICPKDEFLEIKSIITLPSSNKTVAIISTPDKPMEKPEEIHEGEFNWTEEVQGLILGSFFWGYIVTQLPAGILSHHFGGKWLFGLGIGIPGVLALLTPLAAQSGDYWLMALRVGQGLGGGVTVPSMHALLSKWVTPEERGHLSTIVYAGMPFGTAITMLVSGYITHYLGYAAVFYVTGIAAIIWFILWTIWTHESPSIHPSISQEELKYIHSHIGEQVSAEKVSTPWKEILTSLPFWAIMVCHFAETWTLYTLLIEIPKYLKTVLHFDMKQNSWVSAFPHLVMWIFSIIITRLGDFLLQKNLCSTGTVRKICNSIALWGSAAMMIGVAYSGCNHSITICLLTLSVGCLGGIYSGVLCNHIDIAPNFAGLLMGFTNMGATIPGAAAPYLAGVILNDNPSLGQWRKVFLTGAAITFTGNLFFVMFASGEEQKWNRNKEVEDTEMKTRSKQDDVERPNIADSTN